jgi:hypothetical protein
MAQKGERYRRRDHAHADRRPGPPADGVLMPPWYERARSSSVSPRRHARIRDEGARPRLKVIGLSSPPPSRSGRRGRRRRRAEHGRRPFVVERAQYSTSGLEPAIRRGGKLTTPTTSRPSSASRV